MKNKEYLIPLFSNTTLRHIKETLKQFYYKDDKILTKKRIIKESL